MFFFEEKFEKPLKKIETLARDDKLIYNKLLLIDSKELKKKNFF